MKECSTPPSEAVRWLVTWKIDETHRCYMAQTARTAYQAWQMCTQRQVPAFGSCQVKQDDRPRDVTTVDG
jgi:hypothetical protein